MAIQGIQNLTNITINAGAGAGNNTEERAGLYDAFDGVDLTGYQQGGNVNFGTSYINNYVVGGTGSTIISGTGTTNVYISSGVTGDIINNYTYNVTGFATGNFVSIEAFGAIRGGESTAAIQNAVNASFVSGFGIYVPPYRYGITGTIYIPNKEGIKFQGGGGGYAAFKGSTANALAGNNSVIYWSGPTGGVMMQWAGLGVSWDAISLWGSTANGGIGAGTGILITKTGAGSAPGQHDVKSMSIVSCNVAVSCAPSGQHAMLNCEESRWGMIYFIDCPVGFQLNTEQAMGHSVDYYNFYRLWTSGPHSSVQTYGGGTFYADFVFSAAENVTLLDIRGPGPGHNQGAFVFKNVKFDNGAGGNAKLLDMRNWTGVPNLHVPVVNARFQDVKISPTTYAAETGFLVFATGATRVVLDNVDKLQPGMIRMGALTAGGTVYSPNTMIINSRTWLDITGGSAITGVMDVARSTAPYYWYVQGACNFSGVPIRSTGNYVL